MIGPPSLGSFGDRRCTPQQSGTATEREIDTIATQGLRTMRFFSANTTERVTAIRRLRVLLVLMALLLAAAPSASTHAATSEESSDAKVVKREATLQNYPTMHAVLDGKRIPLKAVGGYSCTDQDMPRIVCFRTDAQLWEYVGEDPTAAEKALIAAGLGATPRLSAREYAAFQREARAIFARDRGDTRVLRSTAAEPDMAAAATTVVACRAINYVDCKSLVYDYPDLSVIGMNNNISSYKVQTGYIQAFYDRLNYGAGTYDIYWATSYDACNPVKDLRYFCNGRNYNDIISSTEWDYYP